MIDVDQDGERLLMGEEDVADAFFLLDQDEHAVRMLRVHGGDSEYAWVH